MPASISHSLRLTPIAGIWTSRRGAGVLPAGRLGFLVCLLLVGRAAPGRADVLHLASGTSQECVILQETKDTVRYETALGVAEVPRRKIAAITREPPERNATLRKQWQAARAAAEARRRARQRQAQVERLQQMAMGNVEYEGEWVTPEEKARREAEKRAAQAAADRLSAEEAAAGHEFHYDLWMTPATYTAISNDQALLLTHQDELVAMQQEMALLNDQIENQRMMMLSEATMEDAEERSKRIEELRTKQDELTAKIRNTIEEGNTVAERIEGHMTRARERLRAILKQRGEPEAALQYLSGPE